MTNNNSTRAIGNKAEDLACDFLKKKGYKILERNFLIRGGEIDIIAKDNEFLVFVEVKARYSHRFGLPEESITYGKIKFLKKTALFYLLRINWGEKPYRFDLVTLDFSASKDNPELNLIQNIIEG